MSTSWISKGALLASTTGFLALTLPYITHNPFLLAILPDLSTLRPNNIPSHFYTDLFFSPSKTTKSNQTATPDLPYTCLPQSYQTEIVSLDPLLIYIHSFISPADIAALLAAGEPGFAPSKVSKSGRDQRTTDRTSSSAGLPRDDPAVACVLDRARRFLGAALTDGWDEMGPPQLVRYREGQRFNIHHDWYDTPRAAVDGSGRGWNRVASFFVILQDGCTGGETYFPKVATPVQQPGRERPVPTEGGVEDEDWAWSESDPVWRQHPDGGLAFRPVAGNALFWINLHANRTGDERTVHAGLPVGSGLKTAMNIWPRQYYADV